VLRGRRPLPPGRDVEPDRASVAGGPFKLGVDAASEPLSLDNERPAHTVYVEAAGRHPQRPAGRRRRRARAYDDDPGWADNPDRHLVDVADGVVTVTEMEA
jgi:gamma-glutamyl hercynylcysteine S-oxide synthase